MSSSTLITLRKTRSTNLVSNILDDFRTHLHSPTEFINIYNQYFQTITIRSSLIDILCHILSQTENIDRKISLFILDCLITNVDHVSDIEFKQDLLPFIKQSLLNDDNDILLSTIRFLIVLVEYRSNILLFTLAEWFSALLNFLITRSSLLISVICSDLIIDLLSKIVKQFAPLSKEIVDILDLSSVISTNFLNQLKLWIQNNDDIRLALVAIHLWESLANLLSRFLIRGHAKGNEMLTVIENAFIVTNYSIRSAAYTVWSSFMSHIHHFDDIDPQQLNNRLLKLFLTPFLSDYTSKSKSASISKCHAWLTLISIYPRNLNDIILPFLSFAFGNHISSETISTTTAWWSECRQIGAEYIHELLIKNIQAEYIINLAGDEILNYIFDSIVDQLLEYRINSIINEENSLWLTSWNGYLNNLINIFKSNNSMNENQRVAINTCLLTRIEQLWIDSRIETRFLLKLFETFEQIGFPLAIETVLRDSSIRTKTLSAAQYQPSAGNNKSQDKSSFNRTTLSDQYLHMMLEHAIRFNDEDQTIEETYLHVLSYLIDTLSKTSDENFCFQTCSLLLKCSVEFSHQPLAIPSLFWHIWFRCSTHLINILNRSHTFELNNKIDNQKQETSIELLLRPFAFNDIQRLDYSYTLLWIQLFKSLCRLALINNEQSKNFLINLLIEFLRNEPAFEQAINDHYNQRLFGLILIIIKTILKTFSDIDIYGILDRSNNSFLTIEKRSLSSSIILCFTQLSRILNHILQRLLSNNENNTQYILVCYSLVKSNKTLSIEQSKSFVFTYIRDLIIDLLNICKTYSHLEIILTNLTQFISFLRIYEQSTNINLTITSSPVSIHKQPIDNAILNKILSVISLVFEPANSSSLLQLIYPLLILAFQHNKAIIRNKTRKCWNESFGRLAFIVYPNELRTCLRDLKDREHLLLPCFLADHDNSNTAGSGAPPSSTDESQVSQQVDIATPLIPPPIRNQQLLKAPSPGRFLSPALPSIRSTNIDQTEPIFVPITNNINHNNQPDAPVIIGKRISSTSSCLTEKQKEKLRARRSIPLLCDDSSNTQSSSCTIDVPTIENMMANYQLRNINKRSAIDSSLFKQSISNSLQANNNNIPELLITTNEISSSENNIAEEVINNDEDISEESAIAKKLRRSCRPSISARKSLTNNTRKKRTVSSSNELITTTPVISPVVDPSLSNTELIKKHPLKSILKRLSPTKPRQDHLRRVIFHDQVKVLVFPSPSRRDTITQLTKKSPNKDETKSPTRIIPRENLPLRKQPMSARRLSVMNNMEQIIPVSPAVSNKTRSSKLFHPNDALADWTRNNAIDQLPLNFNESEIKTTDPIFPSLIDCDKPLDSLIQLLSGGVCPTNTISYFHSIKINTIGDIARSTAAQIELYPIPPPKLVNIQKALLLYQERRSVLPSISNITESTASTSEETIPVTNPHDTLYDVDTLINSLDYERLYLDDEAPASTSQTDFLRTKRQVALTNREEYNSPQKRCLSPTNEQEKNDQISPKKATISNLTLGDRLQKAADIYEMQGILPFDDDYIELMRQLFNNSSLAHLEQLHLKTLFLN